MGMSFDDLKKNVNDRYNAVTALINHIVPLYQQNYYNLVNALPENSPQRNLKLQDLAHNQNLLLDKYQPLSEKINDPQINPYLLDISDYEQKDLQNYIAVNKNVREMLDILTDSVQTMQGDQSDTLLKIVDAHIQLGKSFFLELDETKDPVILGSQIRKASESLEKSLELIQLAKNQSKKTDEAQIKFQEDCQAKKKQILEQQSDLKLLFNAMYASTPSKPNKESYTDPFIKTEEKLKEDINKRTKSINSMIKQTKILCDKIYPNSMVAGTDSALDQKIINFGRLLEAYEKQSKIVFEKRSFISGGINIHAIEEKELMAYREMRQAALDLLVHLASKVDSMPGDQNLKSAILLEIAEANIDLCKTFLGIPDPYSSHIKLIAANQSLTDALHLIFKAQRLGNQDHLDQNCEKKIKEIMEIKSDLYALLHVAKDAGKIPPEVSSSLQSLEKYCIHGSKHDYPEEVLKAASFCIDSIIKDRVIDPKTLPKAAKKGALGKIIETIIINLSMMLDRIWRGLDENYQPVNKSDDPKLGSVKSQPQQSSNILNQFWNFCTGPSNPAHSQNNPTSHLKSAKTNHFH